MMPMKSLFFLLTLSLIVISCGEKNDEGSSSGSARGLANNEEPQAIGRCVLGTVEKSFSGFSSSDLSIYNPETTTEYEEDTMKPVKYYNDKEVKIYPQRIERYLRTRGIFPKVQKLFFGEEDSKKVEKKLVTSGCPRNTKISVPTIVLDRGKSSIFVERSSKVKSLSSRAYFVVWQCLGPCEQNKY
jgi:hypothetical protein